MNRQKPATSTQPQVNDTRIYSSKKLPTVKVSVRDGGKELIINQSDFDDRFIRLD